MFKNGDVFGNTPMIKINYKYNGKINNVYVKLEFFSLTGIANLSTLLFILKSFIILCSPYLYLNIFFIF